MNNILSNPPNRQKDIRCTFWHPTKVSSYTKDKNYYQLIMS